MVYTFEKTLEYNAEDFFKCYNETKDILDNNFDFEEATGLNEDQKRAFFKEVPNDEAMKFSSSLIMRPLLKSGNKIEKECIKLFKHLLSYMGLRESSKEPQIHCITKNITYFCNRRFY